MTKRNPKAPDFKCRSRACDGVLWPERGTKGGNARAAQYPAASSRRAPIENPVEFGDLPGVPMDPPPAAQTQQAQHPQNSTANAGVERFNKLVAVHRACFKAALQLADQYEQAMPNHQATLEGVSALAAQLFIALREGR